MHPQVRAIMVLDGKTSCRLDKVNRQSRPDGDFFTFFNKNLSRKHLVQLPSK